MSHDCDDCKEKIREDQRMGGAMIGVWSAGLFAMLFPVTPYSLIAIIAAGFLGWIVVILKQRQR